MALRISQIFINATCDIHRMSLGTANVYNEKLETWSLLYSGIPCRFQPLNAQENIVDNQTVVRDYIIFVNPEIVIKESDRVVINSKTYNVYLVKQNIDARMGYNSAQLRIVEENT